jgi:predicted  nucleic acid-binding Zn-ribbon protein
VPLENKADQFSSLILPEFRVRGSVRDSGNSSDKDPVRALSNPFDSLGYAIKDLGSEFRLLGQAHEYVREGIEAAIDELRESSANLERISKRNFDRVRKAEQSMHDDFATLADSMEALVIKLEKEAASQDTE